MTHTISMEVGMVVKIILEPLHSGWEGRGFLLGRGQDNDASHSTGEP